MRLLPLLLFVLVQLASVACGQSIRFENLSASSVRVWKRTTIDVQPPHLSGRCEDGTEYVVARSAPDGLFIVDVLVSLGSGERKTVDLAKSQRIDFFPGEMPADIGAHFGGPLTVAGAPMQIRSIKIEGAGLTVRAFARFGKAMAAETWLRFAPSMPQIVFGEVAITCSNPLVPDQQETVGAVRLAFGDSFCCMPTRSPAEPIVAAGTTFADGQSRIVPFSFVWPRHVKASAEWASIGAMVHHEIAAVGVSRLFVNGNPHYPQGFSGRAWAVSKIEHALRAMTTWEPAACGPAPMSLTTGDQEEQVWTRGEALLPNAAPAVLVTYLSALKLAARPCHHLEVDGRQLDIGAHPDLVMLTGRPHYSRVVSPDQLGKADQNVGEWMTNGWIGPDRQHWFYKVVVAAYRYTGSDACQWMLENQARLYFFSETVRPNWSTSDYDSSRSVGWAGLLVSDLWSTLEDRTLAGIVAQRWRDRVLLVYIPKLGSAPGAIWQVFLDDPRVMAPEPGWATWQQSLGAYGLDLGCRVIPGCDPRGRQIARDAAFAVLDHGWTKHPDGWWRDWPFMLWTHAGKVASEPYVRAPDSRYADGSVANGGWAAPRYMFSTWMVPHIALVLQHEPDNAKALDILAQQQAWAAKRSWFPPELPTW